MPCVARGSWEWLHGHSAIRLCTFCRSMHGGSFKLLKIQLCAQSQIPVAHCHEIVSEFYFQTKFVHYIPQWATFTSLKRGFRYTGFYGNFQGESRFAGYSQYFNIASLVITRFLTVEHFHWALRLRTRDSEFKGECIRKCFFPTTHRIFSTLAKACEQDHDENKTGCMTQFIVLSASHQVPIQIHFYPSCPLRWTIAVPGSALGIVVWNTMPKVFNVFTVFKNYYWWINWNWLCWKKCIFFL